jgi:hypothetical protein
VTGWARRTTMLALVKHARYSDSPCRATWCSHAGRAGATKRATLCNFFLGAIIIKILIKKGLKIKNLHRTEHPSLPFCLLACGRVRLFGQEQCAGRKVNSHPCVLGGFCLPVCGLVHFPSQPKIFSLPLVTSNLSMHAWSIKCR